MSRSISTLLLLTLSAGLCNPAPAQPPPPGKFANQIKAYTDAADSGKEALGQTLALFQDIDDFAKADIKLMTAYLDHAAATWTAAADALQKGDEAVAKSLEKQARELDSQRDIWNQRLGWRRGQAQREYLPASEQTFALLVGDRKPDEVSEIEAFIEAKKRRSEAYGRLADAALPGADSNELARLQDQVYAADVEVQVADLKRVWADADRTYRLYVATDPKISSPAFTAAKEHLAGWRQKYEETYRRMREVEHALDVHKRQDHAVFDARSAAYRQAKAAQDPPQKGK